MRKIITDKKPATEQLFYLEDVIDSDIIGIKYDTRKLVVIKSKEGYTGLANDLLRIDTNWHAPTIQKYIKDFPGYSGVYKFDTVKELYKWLSE